MNLPTVRSADGKLEYVLLPVDVYRALQTQIDKQLKKMEAMSRDKDFEPFNPADYIDNPIALARLNAHMRQQELAQRMGVTQAYISKLESQTKVSPKVLARVHEALKKRRKAG